MEKRVRIDVYRIRLYCDECGGEMEFTYDVNSSRVDSAGNERSIYGHRCQCGNKIYTDKRYPYDDVVEVSDV